MAVTTLAQEVSHRLLQDIQTGKFANLEKLPPERELVAEYLVGRNTLREAINGLKALGLLEVRAGSGTRIKRFDSSSVVAGSFDNLLMSETVISEILEFRLLLETKSARLASERALPSDHQLIRAALAEYQDAVRSAKDVYGRDVAFHRSIAIAAHNSLFLESIDSASKFLEQIMREADRVPGDINHAAIEHSIIAHHVLLGEGEAAEEAMRTHILAGAERRVRQT